MSILYLTAPVLKCFFFSQVEKCDVLLQAGWKKNTYWKDISTFPDHFPKNICDGVVYSALKGLDILLGLFIVNVEFV